MSVTKAKDHSNVLTSKFRPGLPHIVIEKMVEFMKKRNCDFGYAVDVGCGAGHSTFGLSSYFSKVLGVDLSPSQIAEANSNNTTDNVMFEIGDSEQLSMSNSTVDLISSCTAAHWFDLPVFFKECSRVLKSNGCLLLCAYSNPVFFPESANSKHAQDKLIELGQEAFRNLCSKYTFHKRVAHRYNQYDDIFAMLNANDKVHEKDIEIKRELSFEDFLLYLSTWSPYQELVRERKEKSMEKQIDVLDAFAAELKQKWCMTHLNNNDIQLHVIWNCFMIMSVRPEA